MSDDDVEQAREDGARILAEACADYPDNPDFVAAQRLAPYPRAPDTFTHERIAAALVAARRAERELCAQYIEARAIVIRDNGPRTPEGLLTAIAGAQVGALLDAAASLRLTGSLSFHRPREYEAPRDPAEQLTVRGVGRAADEPRALLVLLSERPTDDEIRSLHDYLKAARTAPWPFDKGSGGSLLAGTNPGDAP